MTGKRKQDDAPEFAEFAEIAAEVRSRYGDVVKAAEAARADGDDAEADRLMATAGRVLALERQGAVAQTEMDNYARSSAPTERAEQDEE